VDRKLIMRIRPAQVAVVTGAASGIGRALADTLAQRGLHVAMGDVEEEPLLEAARDIGRRHGAATMPHVVDVTDAEAMTHFAARTLSELGGVDLVVNNAGVVGPWKPTWQQSLADWRWVLDVNLWGVAHGVRAFLPTLVEQNRGHLVNISSIAGVAVVPGGGNAPYSASKFAVAGLTETLAEELRHAGSRVGCTVVCPGVVATNIRRAARNRPAPTVPVAAVDQEPESAPSRPLEVASLVPAQAAQMIVAAVEEGRLHLFTHDDTLPWVKDRTRRVYESARGGSPNP
jgi:NAD(P)-dependent dehydrogenase (short-subunit alcohol dehydrogenase family)